MIERIKSLRSEMGISQQKLGDSISISQQSINKYENHDVEPDILTLKKLADFFNTSIDYLVGQTDIRRKIENVKEFDLNDEEEKVIQNFRKLIPRYKNTVMTVIEDFIHKQTTDIQK